MVYRQELAGGWQLALEIRSITEQAKKSLTTRPRQRDALIYLSSSTIFYSTKIRCLTTKISGNRKLEYKLSTEQHAAILAALENG